MGLITLPNGQQQNLTKDNADQLARVALQQYAARGVAVDQAATLQAFYEAAGRDTAFQGALSGPGSTSVNFNNLGAVAAQQHLEGNLLASGSSAIFNAAPAQVQRVWQGASDSVVTATDKTVAALRSAANAAADNLPGFLSGLNADLRLAIVGGGVIAVAAAAIYLTMKFK